MFSKEDFASLAEHAVLYVHWTTHIEDQPHEKLFEEVGGRGWPTFRAMDAEGQVIGGPKGGSLDAFTQMMTDGVREYRRLEKAAMAGGPAAASFFQLRMELGGVGVADMKAALADLGEHMTADQRADLRDRIVISENQPIVNEFVAAMQSSPENEVRQDKLLAMYREGKVVLGQYAGLYWQVVGDGAIRHKDTKALDAAIEGLMKMGGRAADAADRFKAAKSEMKKM